MNKVSRKVLVGAVLATVGVLALSGCASKPGAGYIECGVSDEGSWTDKSFNESVMDGMKKAKDEFGVDLKEAESQTPDDFGPNIDAMIAAKCNVIFAVGFALVDTTVAAAKLHKNVNFVTVDDNNPHDGLDNLKPFKYNTVESAYLAGYAAAATSTSKILGTYGGAKYSSVTDFMDGFYFGAKAWERDNGTPVEVLGWDPATQEGQFIGGFAPNSPIGKTIAAGQLAAGADVLLPVGGDQYGALKEAITEAKAKSPDAKNVMMVGVDKDWSLNDDYKPMMLTSILKMLNQSVYDFVKADAVDKVGFTSEPYIGTLKNGGIGITKTDFIDSTLQAKLDELKAGIIAGTIDPRS